MKLLIAGSRNIKEFDLSPYIPKETKCVISGGATGIDTIAEAYARNHRINIMIQYPQYNLYGKAAPIKRNEEMVKMADSVLVVWDGVSKGTKYTIDYAKKLNKDINVVIVK